MDRLLIFLLGVAAGQIRYRRRRNPAPELLYRSRFREPKGYRLVSGSCSCQYQESLPGTFGPVVYDRSTCPIHGPSSCDASFEVIK